MSTELPSFVELAVATSQSKKSKYSMTERMAHCEEWRKSGLSMNEYCRRSGLLSSTFSLWVKKLNDKPPIESEKRLEKISNETHQQVLEIILVSGIRLRFAGIAKMAEVLRLIKALESCS
jgi:hypothetical protein